MGFVIRLKRGTRSGLDSWLCCEREAGLSTSRDRDSGPSTRHGLRAESTLLRTRGLRFPSRLPRGLCLLSPAAPWPTSRRRARGCWLVSEPDPHLFCSVSGSTSDSQARLVRVRISPLRTELLSEVLRPRRRAGTRSSPRPPRGSGRNHSRFLPREEDRGDLSSQSRGRFNLLDTQPGHLPRPCSVGTLIGRAGGRGTFPLR